MSIRDNEFAKKAHIVLADGKVFEGLSVGSTGTTIGEIVFCTAMTGYQEILTDASYFGQIVTMTYPLIGNYGINEEDNESQKSWVSGFIIKEWCETPSNFRLSEDLDSYLKKQNVIGIHDIDTRQLTKIIREGGVINGAITTELDIVDMDVLLAKIKEYKVEKAVVTVTGKEIEHFDIENPKAEVVLMDFGYKKNILRNLNKRGCNVTVVPAFTTPEEIIKIKPDGIMLSNGPGDPAENIEIIENLKVLLNSGIPILGICLGHQLLALAAGASTSKLRYGHRGANQPIRDIALDRTYITSQNHGYAVLGETLDKSIGEVSHINANDDTCEGIKYKNGLAFTVQFHPEASAGPRDTEYLFDSFIELIEKVKKGVKE